jgi:hypothetical protein
MRVVPDEGVPGQQRDFDDVTLRRYRHFIGNQRANWRTRCADNPRGIVDG